MSMSELGPHSTPPRFYPLPPAPPAAIKPIPRWIWIITAVLILAVGGATVPIYKSFHSHWREAYPYIDSLHAKMTQGDDAGIYAQADPAWQQEIGQEKSNHIFDYVRNQLGAPRSTACTNQNISTNATSGTTLVLTFTTVFDKGTGIETLTLHQSNGVYRMIGYNIHSDELKAIPSDIKQK
jgi:hypothetical protein